LGIISGVNIVPSFNIQPSKEIAPFIDIASNSSTDGRPLENILMEVEGTIRAAWTLAEDERRKIIKRLYKKWHPDKNFGNELVTTEVFKFIKQAVLNIERGNDINTRYAAEEGTGWQNCRPLV
jgi:hypothetical protein